MDLLVDIGNNNVNWKCADKSGAFPSLEADFSNNLAANFDQLGDVTRVIFVNVAQRSLSLQLSNYAQSAQCVEIVATEQACGVVNGYCNPRELGADRWVALVGARSIAECDLIVVDAGTAITVDALSSNGQFIGGSILPGIDLSRQSLSQRAPLIADTNEMQMQLPARGTAQAVSSGTVFAAVGGTDRLIEQYSEHLDTTPRLLLTGGSSQVIATYSTYNFDLAPQLTLTGLERLSETIS